MPTYKNADGSYTTVPEGGGAPIRTPVAPSGSSPVPINEGLASVLGNPILSKKAAPVQPVDPSTITNKFLVPREDGKFDQVVLEEGGHSTGVVGPETAIKMRDEGGYRLVNTNAFQEEPAEVRTRLTEALGREITPLESTVGVPMRDGTVRQVPASKVKEVLASPEAAPVTTVPTRNEEWRQGPREFSGFGGDPARMELNAQGQWAHPERPPGPAGAASPEEQAIGDAASARRAEAEKLRANPLESFFTGTPPLAAAQSAPASSTSVKSASSTPGFVPKKTDVGMKDFEEAQRLKASALDTAQSFEEGQAERRRLAMEAAQAEDDKLRAEQQELERQKQEKVSEATQKYVSMLEESQKPGGQLDPGRWWSSRSTGQKVAAVLGQALASFNAGWRGDGKPVDMIGKFVEEDLRQQEAQLSRDDAKQRQGLEAQGKILALTEKQYGDPVQAKAAARAMVWENMDRQLALGEARAGTDAAKAKYAGLRASVAEEAAKAKSDLLFRTEQLHLAQSANAREWKQLQIQEKAAAAKAGATLTPKELQDQVEGLGKDMQPLVRVKAGVDNIDAIMRKTGPNGDIPGTGFWDSRKLRIFDSTDDITMRQAKNQVGDVVNNILSGAGISDTEREHRLESMGLAKGSTEEEFRAGWPATRAFFDNQIRVVNAKYHPLARQVFEERMRAGSTPDSFTPK